MISCKDGEFVLRDLESTQGTFINGERIASDYKQKHKLNLDQVNFGGIDNNNLAFWGQMFNYQTIELILYNGFVNPLLILVYIC